MSPKQLAQTAAEVALAALSVVAMISLQRLFVDSSFLARVITITLISHVLATVLRRLGATLAIATLVSAVASVFVIANVLYPDTASVFVPSRATFDLLGNDLSEAWRIYTDQSAPVPVAPGFVAVLAIVGWWLAHLADWAAFRLRSPVESLAPALSVFVFGALMGTGDSGITHGAAFAGASAAVLIAMRAERQAREESWVGNGARSGIATTIRLGGVSAAIAVLAGVVVAPAIPGAEDAPIVDFKQLTGGPESRTVISPLVEISTSLVQQSNFEIFSVAVDKGDNDYWRLMALNSFDGNVWRRSSKFSDIRGPVGSDVDPNIRRRTITQTITTRRLGNIYLPAAYEVSAVPDTGGIGLEYEKATGALVVKQGDQAKAEAGFTYTIESSVPDFDPSDLPADSTTGLDPGFVAENTALPPSCGPNESPATSQCWPDSVSALARQITAGATTDHQRALMLQNYFLDPTLFTYDLDVALHENVADVEDFLFVSRRGYCEQFSSTFAAMARSLGIPARVAVGFTWGDWDEARGEYIVRGRNAHAWPEVYFAGAGWVAFDPTPGRARPQDSDITGLEAAQFGVNDGANRQVSTDLPTTTTTKRPESSGGAGIKSGSDLSALKDPTLTDQPATPVAPVSESGGGIPGPLKALALMVAALLAVPTARSLRKASLHRRISGSPVARTEIAFDEATAMLTMLGLPHRPHETPLEYERRISREWPQPISGVHELMRAVTVMRYGCPTEPRVVADDACSSSLEIVRHCRSLVGRGKLTTRFLDPRRVKATG